MEITIFQRLTAGFLAIMLMVLAFGAYVVFQLDHLTHIIHLAAVGDSRIIQEAESLSVRLETLVALEKKYWISKDNDFFRLFLKRRQEFLDHLAALNPLLTQAASRLLLQKALTLSQAYIQGVESLAGQEGAGPSAAYESRREAILQTLSTTLDQIRLAGLKSRDGNILRSNAIGARVLRAAICFASACILAGVVVSWLTTRRIVRPILVLQHKTREIAAGRFAPIQELPAPREIRDLAQDFNTMSKRLEELDALKEDFVSHVSHALRTPLTAMREASEMLIRGTFEKDPESRRQLLAIVRDECKRLIIAVNRILDLSRMESGMMEYRFAQVDLNDLILSVVFKLSPIAQAKQIRLHFEPGPACPPVLADTDQMHQLFENLIGNALKFTEPEGRITLKILEPVDKGGQIQVAVMDTGCGIEPEHLENIFTKFRRIEKGQKTARGTGLGLSIAKHIVEAHGGSIWVRSNIGAGSAFYFSLPPA
jgi:signal transduction histidine kinase